MIDIYSIGHIYFSHDDIESAKRQNRDIDNLFASSYLLGALDFLFKFVYFLFKGNKKFPRKEQGSTKVLFYGISRNNRLTLEPIIKEMGDENMVSFVHQEMFPSWKLYWYALPHLFDLIREIRKADEKKRQVFKLFFPKVWRMYGCPPVINEMLDLYKPGVVVMANDHQEFNRCLLMICKERGIKTIYVQHASVGTKFPSLQFTYSLLDGMDAYLKYKQIGNMQGNIYLLGGVRFDVVKPENLEQPKEKVIGLAINLVDSEEKVKKTCRDIQAMGKEKGERMKLMFRSHPQMLVGAWRTWCEENGVIFSSPKEESSFEFIGKSSLVIANQCSIHLDTAMCHKVSVIYNMSNYQGEDVYLFKKNGLSQEANDANELQNIIENPKQLVINDKAVRYYNCSYGTPYEGNVAGIICDLINSLLDDTAEDFNKKRHFEMIEEGTGYRAYRM